MSVYGTESVNAAYELRTAAGKAAIAVRELLPPTLASIVAAEIGWMKDSTWATSQARLKLVIAEITALTEARERDAA